MADIDIKEVSQHFTELLEVGYKIISHPIRPKLTGIHGAQYRLLSLLSKTSRDTMTTLGKTLYISKQNMTNLVESLIREGFVERQSDPDDRRVVYVKITPAGQTHLDEMRDQLREYIQGRIEALDPAELELVSSSIANLLSISRKYL
jgi:DNA-binding MarR family transcriptional regulator